MKKPIKKILELLRNRQGITMLEEFKKKYSPFQILIATVMSARTKDSTTIPLADNMFQTLQAPDDFLTIELGELEKLLYPIGFYKVKAKNIKKLCEKLISEFDSKVPQTMDELLSLPGVGRKTANCVLAYAFQIPAIPVDIHVHRISNRIGLVKTTDPLETEVELTKTVPKKLWLDINELLVVHGQTICLPRNPQCDKCPIAKCCDYNLIPTASAGTTTFS